MIQLVEPKMILCKSNRSIKGLNQQTVLKYIFFECSRIITENTGIIY